MATLYSQFVRPVWRYVVSWDCWMMTVAANLLSSGPTYQSSMLAISAQSLLVQLIRMAKLLMIDKAMRMLPFGGRPMALLYSLSAVSRGRIIFPWKSISVCIITIYLYKRLSTNE